MKRFTIHGVFVIFIGVFYWMSISVEQYQMLLLFFFAELCILSLTDSTMNLFQIFLVTFFVFILSRIVLDAFGLRNFMLFDLYEKNPMDTSVALDLLKILILFLAGISLGWCFFKAFFPDLSKRYFHHKTDFNFRSIIKGLLLISLVLYSIKVLITLWLVSNHGYFSVIHGEISQTYKYPWFLKGVGILSKTFLILNLYYDRSEKNFKVSVILFLLPLMGYMFSGQRGSAIYTFLVLVWIWGNFYRKIKMPILIGSGLTGIFIIHFIELLRTNHLFNSFLSLKSAIYNLMNNQGVSLTVIANTIRFKDQFTNQYPFLFGYITDMFTDIGKNHSIERVLNGNYLANHITYQISPKVYFSGASTGTSIIAEFYELANANKVLVFAYSFILMILMMYICNHMYKNVVFFTVAYFAIGRFIYSPRDSVGKVIGDLIIPVFLIGVAAFMNQCAKYRNRINLTGKRVSL